MFRPPRFDRERKLRGPHEKWRENGKPWIQPRIQPLDAQDETSNRFRRGSAVRVENPAQFLKFGALPVFPFQACQDEGKDIEMFYGIRHSIGYIANFLAIMTPEHASCGQGCNQEPSASKERK